MCARHTLRTLAQDEDEFGEVAAVTTHKKGGGKGSRLESRRGSTVGRALEPSPKKGQPGAMSPSKGGESFSGKDEGGGRAGWRVAGTAAENGVAEMPPSAWHLHTHSVDMPAEFIDEQTLRVTAPDLRHQLVEGPATIDVSLHAPLPGKGRVWTSDHVEVSVLAKVSPQHTQWFGDGLAGGQAGRRCTFTACTMDTFDRPKRLGGIPMALELVWLRPTEEAFMP
jgi:hypothetical protein